MILERKEEPKPEPSNLNLEIRTGIATDTIPTYFSNWEPEVLHTLVSKNQTKTSSELEVGLGPEPSPWFFKNQNQTEPEIPVSKNWNQEFWKKKD